MFTKDKREKFSLRKYKDGRTDSKLIGATILIASVLSMVGINTVSANVVSNGTNEPTIVSDTAKVESAKATTFTDDTDASKTFKVDAVLDGGATEPTKANINTGDADGNDTVNFKSGATVNYKLDSDKSLLKTETVEAATGTVTTPYDKKGLASDTDGKDYRESTVAKTGDAVSEATGKKDTVEANNKVYEYVRSEIEGADKPTYNKTSFNNIEAAVSPEGMHNKLGEIDYTKTAGKVYLVEETADGQYGKFVEANGVSSDEDAVTKWKAGEATAKEFTKENVTLQEGDTVLVLDKDTYATTNTVERKSKKTGTPVTYVAVKENIYDGTSTDIYGMTYAILRENYEAIKDIGEDGVFGTVDDSERRVTPNGTQTTRVMDVFDLSSREDKSSNYLQRTPDLDTTNASVKDILKDISASGYRLVELFASKAQKPADIEAINTVKTNLDNKIDELVNYMKENNIRVGLSNNKVGFYVNEASSDNDSSKLDQFENKVREVRDVLSVLPIVNNETRTNASEEEAERYGIHDSDISPVLKDITETFEYTNEGGLVVTKNTKFDRDEGSAVIWNKYPEESENKINISNVTTNGTWGVTVADDKNQATLTRSKREVKELEPSDETTTDTATVTKKEIITPIRAYKVMGEEKPVVTHYYNLKITKEEAGAATATKQGSVVIKYVTTDGKQLKSETDKDNVTLETKTIVSLYSGETKVDERTDIVPVEQNYDTTPKQYPTLVDADTGFTYEYVGLKQGSPAASGKVVEGTTEVVYEYRLVSNEEATPSKSEVKKTGSVDVTHVFKTSNGEYKTLKTEVVKDTVALEYEDTYVTYSGNVKVSERKATRTVEENYDTADKQYPTLKDPDTGFTYKYVGLKEGSASVSGKVVEGNTHVVYEYTLVSEEEKVPSKSVATKTGSVDVKHVVINEDGSLKTLKEAEIVKNNVPLEYEDTYVTYSNGVKVSERKEKRAVTEKYDTTDKQYPTLKDEATGLVYKYVGQTSDSAQATGDVAEGEKHVIYSYTLDKQEETTPFKTVDAKGSVVVKYVDADGNEIKDAENVVTDTVVKTTKTYATKSGDVTLSTRDEVEEHTVDYDTQVAKEQTITKDGKKYNFYRVLPVDTKFNNVTEETGTVKEGVTTIVYQYDYIIPVDPTKPNEGEQNPPKPGDKIPNDPLNRTYEQAGLVKNVTRTIDYQYASGPKKGEKASESVVQTARFTRKAEMNARTGELAYEPWSAAQTLEKVISPVIDTYAVDKENVEALEVNSESKDTKELVQYTLNVRVIEHDADKDKKGSVIVKFVDSNENPIASDVVLKDKITVALAKTVITGDKEETTYTLTNETYTAKAEETIEVDGIQFKLKRILPAGAKWNNAVEESGLIKEGLTTIVYQYTMQMSTPVVDVPDYTEPVGTVPNDAPVYDIPEFNGGVNGIPEVHEKPEFTGGVNPIDPPVLEVPELVIPLIPMEEMSDPRPVEKPKPKPTPKEDVTVIPADFSKQEEPKVKPEPKPVAEAPHANHEVVPQEEKAMLPNTGGGDNSVLSILGGLTLASVLGVSLSKRKED